MSASAPNPYRPPPYESKLTAAEAADIKHRDIAVFVLLMVVTLGFYWLYLAYQWAKEVNGLQGRAKYQPLVVLLVSILTCTLAGFIFEILYAFDIAQATESRGVKGRMEQLGTWVVVCNCVALLASLVPGGVVIGFPLGILASVFVQVELNKLAEQIGGHRVA